MSIFQNKLMLLYFFSNKQIKKLKLTVNLEKSGSKISVHIEKLGTFII